MVETEFHFTDNLHSICVATTLHFAVAVGTYNVTSNCTRNVRFTARTTTGKNNINEIPSAL